MSIICDANKLPEEIKQKAQEYTKHKRSQFRTFGISPYDIENAWLQGFAFCTEGQITIKLKQCATCVYADSPCTPSDYAKTDENECIRYKNVFSAYAKLKTDYEEGQRKNNELSDNLTNAKEIISEYINILKGNTKNWKHTQEKAEQFIKDSEVEK